jgi:hypothetical protein
VNGPVRNYRGNQGLPRERSDSMSKGDASSDKMSKTKVAKKKTKKTEDKM